MHRTAHRLLALVHLATAVVLAASGELVLAGLALTASAIYRWM